MCDWKIGLIDEASDNAMMDGNWSYVHVLYIHCTSYTHGKWTICTQVNYQTLNLEQKYCLNMNHT